MPKTYSALVLLHEPRIIRGESCHVDSIRMVSALAGFPLNQDQEDYLELVSNLIEEYETTQYPEKYRDTLALAEILRKEDFTVKDLARIMGVGRSTAYKIARGFRIVKPIEAEKLDARFPGWRKLPASAICS